MDSEKNNNSLEKQSNVAPTDLRITDIETFGQENIPLMDMNRKANITDFDLSTLNSLYSNIGTVPPGSFTESTKKPINIKFILFIILIIVIIGLIGLGIYFYLSSTKNVAQNAVVTKNVEVNIGDKLSLKLEDYAEFKDIKATNCILNIKDVDTSKAGKYNYSIKCGINEYKGKVLVIDNKAPALETKVVFKNIGADLDVNDFVLSCADSSGCSYVLSNFDLLKEKMQAEGVYTALIEASDNEGNKITVSEKLIVSNKNVSNVYVCSYDKINLSKYKGYYVINESVTIADNYGDILITKINYTIEKKDDYNKLKKSVDENNNLDIEGLSGEAYFDDVNQTIDLYTVSKVNEVSYFGDGSFYSINNFYSQMGYSCNTFNN